jgi:hypothetical protein
VQHFLQSASAQDRSCAKSEVFLSEMTQGRYSAEKLARCFFLRMRHHTNSHVHGMTFSLNIIESTFYKRDSRKRQKSSMREVFCAF